MVANAENVCKSKGRTVHNSPLFIEIPKAKTRKCYVYWHYDPAGNHSLLGGICSGGGGEGEGGGCQIHFCLKQSSDFLLQTLAA